MGSGASSNGASAGSATFLPPGGFNGTTASHGADGGTAWGSQSTGSHMADIQPGVQNRIDYSRHSKICISKVETFLFELLNTGEAADSMFYILTSSKLRTAFAGFIRSALKSPDNAKYIAYLLYASKSNRSAEKVTKSATTDTVDGEDEYSDEANGIDSGIKTSARLLHRPQSGNPAYGTYPTDDRDRDSVTLEIQGSITLNKEEVVLVSMIQTLDQGGTAAMLRGIAAKTPQDTVSKSLCLPVNAY
jgi:hypothetical protein